MKVWYSILLNTVNNVYHNGTKYPMMLSSQRQSRQAETNSPNSPGSARCRDGNFCGHGRHFDVISFVPPLYTRLSGCPL